MGHPECNVYMLLLKTYQSLFNEKYDTYNVKTCI